MKVLVSGATGFIASYLIPELLNRGVEVIATAIEPQLPPDLEWAQKVTYKPFSLDNPVDLPFEYFLQPDKMIHLAWGGLPNYRDDYHMDTNLPRQFKFLREMIEGGLKSLTVTGTCFEYGMQEGELKEDTPTIPDNPYGKAKDELRKMLFEVNQQHNIDLNWLRLFYMYGDGQGPKSLYTQLMKAIKDGDEEFNMSGGEQVRDFLEVNEIISNIASIALSDGNHGIVNCCSGKGTTVNELVDMILKREGAKIKLNRGYYPYPDWEPMAFWGNSDKLRRILDSK